MSYDSGTAVVTRGSDGQYVELSRFGVAKDQGGYFFYLYVRMKHGSPDETDHHTMFSGAEAFETIATSGHPYGFDGQSCRSPALAYKDLYDGESNEGWICSEDIDPQYITSNTYTLDYEGGDFDNLYNIPVVDLKVTLPSP